MRTELVDFIAQLDKATDEVKLPRIPVTKVTEEFGMIQIEDGKEYSYPQTLSFNIESWDTFKYSLRLKDLKFIKEGTDLNSNGFTADQVIQRVVANKHAHMIRIERNVK